MIILNKKLSLILFVTSLLLSIFLIVDLTIDLLNNNSVNSRLISLSVILSSLMIFFYNWTFQENNKNKLKRFLLIASLIIIVDSLAIITYSLFSDFNSNNYSNLFISLGLTITVLLYLMFYKREVTWRNKVYEK
jgi:hypothetical protein